MQFIVVRMLLLIFCLLTLVNVSSAALLKGKATVDVEPVAGITVQAYPVSTLDFKKPAPYQVGPTGKDGLFSLDLPQGEYYLLATGKNLFNYYGRNPVSVSEPGLENINLLMLSDSLPKPEDLPLVATGISGTVSLAGQPVPNAIVMIYTDLSSRLKGMGMGWVPPTDEKGYFEFPLPAGSYYLVVRVRTGGKLAGPLGAGDLFGYFPGNPLSVKEQAVARVHIPLIEVPEKVERYAESLFGSTLISGRVVDAEDQPVAGIQVLLYDDPMMLNRPLYVSQKTAADGSYTLSFPEGGVYYLAARNELGGTPAPGELYGRYQGSADHSIKVQTGQSVEAVALVVEEVY